MGKPTICKSENKGADQLGSNCEADQRLCFRYTDSTIPLLSKFNISSLEPSSVTVQPGLCPTWSEPKLLVFSSTGSFKHNYSQEFGYLTFGQLIEKFFSCQPRLQFSQLFLVRFASFLNLQY